MTAVTADMVKMLRDETGAPILDCKKALEEYGGDMEKAKEYLTEKGLAKAAKKQGRAAREGLVETYSHPGQRVGVMVEVNCETDFVARTEQFSDFAHDIALHIAFSNPTYLDESDVPEEVLEEQKNIFAEEAKAQGKPDEVVDRIVEGKMSKWLADVCLLKQSFVKDEDKTIEELVSHTIAELKENIVIRQFARFELGEASGEDEGEE